MRLNRRIIAQLTVFIVIAVIATGVMVGGYMKLPARFFGVGQYSVTVELPESGGLYDNSNVTYRGTQVGRVKEVRLTPTGVQAVLSLDSAYVIPSNVDAQVHSVSAAGEQYLALVPRDATSAPLRKGDVIPRDRTTIPPGINALLDATNRGLQAIPRDNLKTAIDETSTAVGGLGPELSRISNGLTALSGDARANLGALDALIDQSAPVLDSQTETAGAISAWTNHVAAALSSVQRHDSSLARLLDNGAAAADEARALVDRVRPTVPLLLANLVTVGQVALTYRADLEQLLVLLPQTVAIAQAGLVPDADVRGLSQGAAYMTFNLNFGLPPQCTTGFLPAQQKRVPTHEDYPDRPAGDLYCRVPQDSMFNVRGARNIPCETRPGKRAPTVAMCESGENYIPLNDGFNWKGDPNATLSGQGIPQLPPGTPASQPPQPPPLAAAEYDPATGLYVGPDGRVYNQSDLSHPAKEQTWQSMLMPPN